MVCPVLCVFVVRAVLALLCVLCVCGARVGGGRGGVCCVHAGVCVVCWWCVWVPVLASLGLGWRLCVSAGAVCRGPSPALAVVPRHSWLGYVGGVVFPRRPLCVLCPLFLLAASPGPLFPWCLVRVYPGCVGCAVGLAGGGEGSLTLVGSFPLVFPLGGADACTPRQGVTLLYGLSICTRSIQMYPLRSPILQPFPTTGSGTLWVAGESLRDRGVSCLP